MKIKIWSSAKEDGFCGVCSSIRLSGDSKAKTITRYLVITDISGFLQVTGRCNAHQHVFDNNAQQKIREMSLSEVEMLEVME